MHIWTLRNEDRYLAWDFEQDVYNAFYFYLSQHVDGVFTDFPQSLVRYLNVVYSAGSTTKALYWSSVIIAVPLLVFGSLINQ